MADEDKSSKTEQPTGKRLGEAANKGNVARSMEIANFATLAGAAASLVFLAPWMMKRVTNLSVSFIGDAHLYPADSEHIRLLMVHVMGEIGIIMAPLVILFTVIGLVSNIAQVGWNPSLEKLELKFSMLSPIAGLKRMFGPRALVDFFKGILKIGLVSAIFAFVLLPRMEDVDVMPSFTIDAMLQRISDITYIFIIVAASLMVVIAAADYAWQKHDHIQNLKMTKQEVKDEHKQAEGDPKVKQRIAQLRMERAQQRMMMAVARADVIITNPTHYAVALSYDMDNMAAPKLVGKGVDEVAMRIREVADENKIPIVENPPLARAIYAAVELDQEIPPKYYQAVAEVISYVFRLTGRLARRPGERLVAPKPDWSLDPEREKGKAAE
jgi:flagellar biosynthetic protein FlhB